MESIRFALAAFADATRPVTLRRAQQWVARMMETGLIDRARLTLQDGSAIWATQKATGTRPLNLLGQTFRHEVAVASASARYLFNGWSWARDRKASSYHDHQADGIATRGDETELVEVELTPKAIERYGPICTSHSWRMSNEGITRVVYLCTADATRMVRREADRNLSETTAAAARHDYRVRQTRDLDRRLGTFPDRVDVDRVEAPTRTSSSRRGSSERGPSTGNRLVPANRLF